MAIMMSNIASDHDEAEPLLAGDSTRPRPSKPARSKKLLVLIVCSIVILSWDFGFYLSAAPQIQIFEQIICQKYQADLRQTANATQIELQDDPCKSEAVQGELALVNGYKESFDMLPSILPYAILADHWGRKPVLYLGILGTLLAEAWLRIVCWWSDIIPLRMVWFSGFWKLIGGGELAITSVILVIVADVFSEEERATAIFRLQSCVTLSEVLATPVSAYLMTFDPWLPYLLGLVIILLGTILTVFLPETFEDAKAKLISDAYTMHGEVSEPGEVTVKRTFLNGVVHHLRELKKSTRFLWTDLNIGLVILMLLVTCMSRTGTNLLLQYASKRFNWSIARASLLISLRGVFSLVNYMILMPTLSFLCAKYLHLHGKWRDQRLSQATGVLSVIGFAALAVAPVPGILIAAVVILALGSAFPISARSLATSLVLPDRVGTLYSAISSSQSLGMMAAGPMFAYLFKLGMHLGRAWMGLPFLQAAVFYIVASVAVSCIHLRPLAGQESEEQEPLLSG